MLAADQRGTPKQRLKGLTHRAVDVLSDLMECPTAEPVRLKAAMEVLDRNDDTSKLQRIVATSVVLSGEDALAITESIRQGELVAKKYGQRYLTPG